MTDSREFPMGKVVPVEATPYLSDIADQVGEMVIRNGVAVVKSFVTPADALIARRAARNMLIPNTPVRAVRAAAELVLGRERTPSFLQRRAFQLRESHWRLLGSRTAAMLDEVQEFNTLLFATAPVREHYGDELLPLNTAVLNRFAPHEEFEKHQDSTINTGLSYVLQTSPTEWHIHAGGPISDEDAFGFMTDAGDLVVQAQRSGVLDKSKLPRHTGFTDYLEDGSVVHSGINLTPHNRYTIALFRVQPQAHLS